MLTIGLVLPDVLGTYGDEGNAIILRERARARGYEARIIRIGVRDDIPESLDLYCIGGGEDTAQILAAEHLTASRGLQRAVARSAPVLAICAGFQVLGESFSASGRTIAGIGLLDATSVSLGARAIGELVTSPSHAATERGLTEELLGFENHGGATLLGTACAPLGHVLYGVGNTDSTGAAHIPEGAQQILYEGALQGSIVATYMHGCVLARNPQLADYLLGAATQTDPASWEALPVDALSERLRAERRTAAHARRH